MNWTQEVNPLNSIGLSAIVAAIPVLFIFWALIIKKMKGYQASLLTMVVAVLISVFVYGMPVKLAALSALNGAMYGLFPICWIIIGAIFLYNVTVKSGQFEIIKNFMASITPDRRLQALLIAFSFGAFLEGAAGFGTPVAITASMLIGLGYNPLYAAGICLIANTAPVAFGSIGTPVIIASQVSDLPEMAISQMVGRTLPLLSVFVPFYLVVLISGFKKTVEVLPAVLVCGISFAFFQWVTSNYLGPMLPDIIAGLASIISLMVLLKYWKPKSVWHFKEEPEQKAETSLIYSKAQVFRAWSPFIIMTIMIIAWGLQPVKDTLNSLGDIKFVIPGLQNTILKPDGSQLIIKPFDFNYLSSSGLAMLLAAVFSMPLIGMSFKAGAKTYLATLNQLKFPVITIASVLGFAFVANYSSMSVTIAMALAGTGALFPFFSPVLGWLGVFLTGSDTSSNALFCRLQHTTSASIGVDPLVTVAANASGGVTGKMISPQSIAIGAASVGLVGKEGELFRFTLKHSFIMLFLLCVMTFMQAYIITWVVPEYKVVEGFIASRASNSASGFYYILFLIAAISTVAATVVVLNRSKSKT
jgi:lactate permease